MTRLQGASDLIIEIEPQSGDGVDPGHEVAGPDEARWGAGGASCAADEADDSHEGGAGSASDDQWAAGVSLQDKHEFIMIVLPREIMLSREIVLSRGYLRCTLPGQSWRYQQRRRWSR